MPLKFDEIQGNLQNYNWHMHSGMAPPEERRKRPRNKTADTAENAQSRHRSKLVKTTGPGSSPKRASIKSKGGRPNSQDGTPTPRTMDKMMMNQTGTETQQLQFNPAFPV